jgi:pteridine reductase
VNPDPPRQAQSCQRILVTGGARRVGREIALAFAQTGARIAVHYHRSADDAQATREQIARAGGTAWCLRADLSDRDETRNLVDEAIAVLGGLDVLVVNAAGYERVTLDDLDDPAWDRMIELNLTSPLLLAKRAASALRESRGSIVFLTCASATTPFRNHLPYVVSKGALRHLMRVLALELAPDVRVNAVAPGTVLPPDDLDRTALPRLRGSIPLQHFGTPRDVAQAVLFLANSPFVTGHELMVDGGRAVAKVERFG